MPCSCCCALQAQDSQKLQLAPVTGGGRRPLDSQCTVQASMVLCTAGGWRGLQPLHAHSQAVYSTLPEPDPWVAGNLR